MNQTDSSVRIAILSIGILLMGVVGIASGLAEIAKHFSDVSQTSIQLLITLPCIVIIFVNPLIGKLDEFVAKKNLVLFGIVCFLLGGMAPAFLDSFKLILACRAVLGVGVAITQVLSSALVAEYFAGDERTRVMGQLSSAQMLGCAFMFFTSGYLAVIDWNITFYVHAVALISLICVALFLPKKPPVRVSCHTAGANKPKLTPAALGWTVTTLIFFIGAMTLANFLAFFVTDHQLGSAAQAGQATMVFAIGGVVTGFLYGKLVRLVGHLSLSVGLFLGTVSFLIIALSPNLPILYCGSFLYGGTVTIVFASIMMGTSLSVSPAAVPLAMSIVIMGQNLGSFINPYVISALAQMIGSDMNRYAFIVAALLFIFMGGIALFWGMAKNAGERRAAQTA